MLVIYNANIHTLDPLKPAATAMAIDDGKVVAIGTVDDIRSTFTTTNIFNANGQTIIPGLTDAHIHLQEYALNLQKVDCETTSRQECLDRVSKRTGITLPGQWIFGHGWNQNNWPEGYGSASLLDSYTSGHPAYLTHKSLHCAWANTPALHLAGITANTPDPESGKIGRLPNGEPNGILFEAAMGLIEKAIPAPSIEQLAQALKAAIPLLWKMGLTAVHDFDQPSCFSALLVLHQKHELKLRVLKSLHQEQLQQAIDIGLRSSFGDDMLRIGSLKLFADGALGPQTAAMLQPYENDPGNLGMLMLSLEQLVELGKTAIANGISLAVHAIGDLANRTVLDAYAKLREFEHILLPDSHLPLRHRIEHVQVLHPDDLPRFAWYDILASMQPIHATSDMLMADRYWGERSAYAYAWRSLQNNGAKIIFGSDAPVESPNPFWGIHAAVTRRRADGTPSVRGWYPEQCLTIGDAIKTYTISAAYAAGMEEKIGLLAPGYYADLLVLNTDPYTCQAEELLAIQPTANMVNGEWVYSQDE